MIGFTRFADLPELTPGALDEAVLAGGHFFNGTATGLALKGVDVFGPHVGGTVEVGGFDLDPLVGVVVFVGREFGDGLEGVVTLDDLAEDGVFAIEFPHVAGGDVELAAAGLAGGVGGVVEAGHANGAEAVTEFDLGGEGGFEPSCAPAGAGAWVFGLRVAHLDKVVGDDAVNGHAVIVVSADVFLEVGDGEGGVCGVELDDKAVRLTENVELEDGDVVFEVGSDWGIFRCLLLADEDDFRDFGDHAFDLAHGAAVGEHTAAEGDDGD